MQALFFLLIRDYYSGVLFYLLDTVFDYLEQNNSTERFLLFIDLLSMVTVQNDCDVFKLTEGMLFREVHLE